MGQALYLLHLRQREQLVGGSPNGSNSTNFCNVNSNGNANYNNASNANGVAFGFCKRWVRTVTGSGEAAPLQKESLFPA